MKFLKSAWSKISKFTAHQSLSLIVSLFSVVFAAQAYRLSQNADERSAASDFSTAEAVALARLSEFQAVETSLTEHRTQLAAALNAKDFGSALSTPSMHFALSDDFIPKLDIPLEEFTAIGRAYPEVERISMKCRVDVRNLLIQLNDARNMLNQGPIDGDPEMQSAQLFLKSVQSLMPNTLESCNHAADELGRIAIKNYRPFHNISERMEGVIRRLERNQLKLADGFPSPK